MYPFIKIFSLNIPTYGLIAVVGIAVAFLVAYLLAKKKGCADIEMAEIAVAGGVGVFLGAHLLFAITRADAYVEAFNNYDRFENFFEFLKRLFELAGGMVFYGGLLGGLLCGYLYARIKRYPLDRYIDIFAVVIPLFHAFGRVGCFMAGCCYGVESELGIAGRLIAKDGHFEAEKISRLPIQLIEAVLLIVLFAVLLVLYKKRIALNKLMYIYLASYSVMRFTLEFFRGDEIRGRLLGLSTSQWISILLLFAVIVLCIVGAAKGKKTLAEHAEYAESADSSAE